MMVRLFIICNAFLVLLSAKMTVSVSIAPQAFFVKKIAGDLVDINVMVDQGKSPETYEPNISQVKELSKSSVYFLIGMPFENAWKSRFKNANPKMKIIPPLKSNVLDEYMNQYPKNTIVHSPIGNFNNSKNLHDRHAPHIWLSFVLSAEHAKNITQTLKDIDPSNKDIYENNLQDFLASINSLFIESKQYVKNSNIKTFLVYHPAFSYMANELGLVEIAIEKHGKEAKISHMQDVLALIKAHNINSILVQPQFSKRSAEVIAREANLNIAIADPLEYNWLDNMRNIVKTICSH